MADQKISQLASGAPATLTDAVPIFDVSANATHSLTIQDILTAIGLLTASSPGQAADIIAAVRAGAPIALTLADVAAAAFRGNYVDNGTFEVNQRNVTTYALTNAPVIGCLDRWWFLQAGTAAGVAKQENSTLAGFSKQLRLQRTAASAQTGLISATQALETIDAKRLQGKQVCLSWYAAKGANFSGAASAMSVNVAYGTGTDQLGSAVVSGTWTGQTNLVNTTQAVAGAYARYSQTFTVPVAATQLGVQLGFTPTGVAGADDSLLMTGVRIDEGSTPPVLVAADPFSIQLVRCQRFLGALGLNTGERLLGFGTAANTGIVNLPFKVRMRTAPTGVAFSALADWNIYAFVSATLGAATALNLGAGGVDNASIGFSVAAGVPTVAAGTAVQLLPANANALILLTGAEI